RYCHTQAHVEVENILRGTKGRFRLLGVADPEMAVVDNCCHIKNAILAVFPTILVVLDLWHFMMRYLICIVNGTKNPHRTAVARDLSGAIVKCTANGRVPAVYWGQSEQENRLQAVYDKWSAQGGVWSAAAEKTHLEQLGHVQKGCLARPRDDIRSDGSRIEGVHKGFNSLQRSFASGLVIMLLLLHDYILRRNVRIEFASNKATRFIQSTHGSHHVRLVDACAKAWNALITAAIRRGDPPAADIHPLPELLKVESGERFGLVTMSSAVAAQQSFVTIKDEPDDGCDLSAHDLLDAAHVLGELGIDPALLNLPLPQAPGANSMFAPAPAAIFSQEPTSSRHIPTSSHAAARGAADVPLPLVAPHSHAVGDQPPPKKKARLYVPGTPNQSSSLRHPSASLQTISGTQRIAPAPHTASSSATPAQLSGFFGPRRPEAHANSSVKPRVPAPTISGTTPSQRLFSIATGIDSRHLSFASSDSKEFFLFMDLRERHKWTSFGMSPFDWVCAASVYNQELERINAREGRAFIIKTPRALMEQLAKIETKILARLATNNFTSKKTDSTAFWTRHCHAVSLTNKSQTRGEPRLPQRFNHTCSRCQKLMYPGKTGADVNHRKAFCSDGVWQKPRTVEKILNGQNTKISEEPPQYPQPTGVFSRGTTFHPVVFLQEVQTLYERVIERTDAVTMQDLAFASMLNDRSLTVPASDGQPAMILFKLFTLDLVGTFPQSLLVEYDGHRYLRMDCLDDPTERGGEVVVMEQ
ncbi:hypothetical protein K466DRAFT_505420, partial [Polyporus arcularius HHB13444]